MTTRAFKVHDRNSFSTRVHSREFYAGTMNQQICRRHNFTQLNSLLHFFTATRSKTTFKRLQYDIVGTAILLWMPAFALCKGMLLPLILTYFHYSANNCRAFKKTINLANKFSQCTFSVAEHYDLFSGLIILFYDKRHCVDRMTSYRTDRTEPTEKLLQEKLNATIPTWN